LQPLLQVIDVDFRIARVADIQPNEKQIVLEGAEPGSSLSYDSLILASGSRMRKLQFPGASQYGFNIDTYDETARFDQHLAELVITSETLTVVVVGSGSTGLELVTELRKRLGPEAHLILLDHSSQVARNMGVSLNPVIVRALSDCDVDVRINSNIASMDKQGLVLEDGGEIKSGAVVFATGLEASPLTEAFDGEKDRAGRLHVDQYLNLPADGSVFIAGDTARGMADDDHTTFMCCQHALQLGRFAGHNSVRSLMGKPLKLYRQENYVTCLDLGPAGAVYTTGWEREIQNTGVEGKEIKKRINHKRIYPPGAEASAESIFQFITLEPEAVSR